MLKKHKSVFILGAGSNEPYGLPLGEELYQNIWKNFADDIEYYYHKILNSKNLNHPDIHLAYSFKQDLSRFSKKSIDKFLNFNEKYSKIGKIAIISEILKSECFSNLPNVSNEIKGDWVTYLWDSMIQDLDSIEDYKIFNTLNDISIITFNYDRLFEHLLFENLYGLLINNDFSRLDVAEILKKIPIIHVYGKIGFLPWEKDINVKEKVYHYGRKITSYGFIGENSPIPIGNHFYELIEITYKLRHNNQEIIKAHNLIKNAAHVYFLGFGFDNMNIDILNLRSLLKNKKIFASTYDKTQKEIINIKLSLGLDSNAVNFINTDCLGILRNYLE